MGLYSEHILPRLVHRALSRAPFAEQRPRCVGQAAGRVLEIGFGSGLNLPFYGPGVTSLLAVEPSALARRLAAPLLAASPLEAEFIGLDGQTLPLADASVDCVVSTWTLCTLPDIEQALAEVRRVLRPGGRLHFLEHGRSPDASVARWQERLNPLHRCLAGGCNLDRHPGECAARSGLEVERCEEFDLPYGRLVGLQIHSRL